MRIRIQDLLLGVILLLGLSLAPRAYTLNTAVLNTRQSLGMPWQGRSSLPFVSGNRQSSGRFPLWQSSVASSEFESKEQRPIYNLVEGKVEMTVESTESTTTSRRNNNKRNVMSVVAVVAIFLVSQFASKGATSPAASALANETGSKGVLFSAVSATLLRQQKRAHV